MGETEYHFRKLTPADNVDISTYEKAIDFALDKNNSDIKNIAISGPYGSGKSSIFASYTVKHPEKKFISISLAHFQALDQDDAESPVKESVIEGKILNQLIHQIPAEKIPQTNFRIKKDKDLSKKRLRFVATVLSVFTVSLVGLIFWEKFSSLESPKIVSILVFIICIGMLGASTSIIVRWFVRAQLKTNIFRRVKLQGNEIEIFEQSDESYFDKYLNEVLYLFDHSGADAIVFEDIDRFSSISRLFERLHEASTLVNTRRKKKGRILYASYTSSATTSLILRTG